MKMLQNQFPVFVFFLLGAIPLHAQNAGDDALSNPELVDARAMIRESHDATIRQELRLSEEESAAFWPLYQEYRADMLPIQDRYVAVIAGYMRNYESGVLTEEYAADLLDDYFDIKTDLLRMRKRYVRKFRKVLPMLKVARFYQLENKMNAEIDIELALAMPLFESN